MDIPGDLRETVGKLLNASLASSSKQQYNRVWKKFDSFCAHLGITSSFPTSVPVLLLLIAHLKGQNTAPSAISSYISILSFFHKINNHPDPTRSFLVAKTLAGARNLSAKPDARLPVTLPILYRLLQAAPAAMSSFYEISLVNAMMVLAFRAYLRVGEMVPRSEIAGAENCLHFEDIKVEGDAISVQFRSFKHSGRQGPQILQVDGAPFVDTPIYPAAIVKDFLHIRGSEPGLLFVLPGNRMYCRRQFDKRLKNLLSLCGLSSSSFKGHSFRIGAASLAASQGKSDAQIRAAGRWASDAFRKYIRIA